MTTSVAPAVAPSNGRVEGREGEFHQVLPDDTAADNFGFRQECAFDLLRAFDGIQSMFRNVV